MNILIVNVHSAGNLGDDGIMFETLRQLKAEYPGATITVAANDPDSWRHYHDANIVSSMTALAVDRKGGRWRWRKFVLLPHIVLLLVATAAYRLFNHGLSLGIPAHRDLLRAYYDADVVISCGGGNFYAHKRISLSFIWALLTLEFALWLGKEVVLLPQSVGPIAGQHQRLLAGFVFNRVSRILVRERRSLAFLQGLGVRKPALVVPDLAFGLADVPRGRVLSIREDHRVPRVGVTVIDRAAQKSGFCRQQTYEGILASVLVELNAVRDAQVFFFVQCSGPTRHQDDSLSTRRVYEQVSQHTRGAFLLDSFDNAVDIRSAYGQMDCVIASRMHSAVFALSNTVPIVLIAYQPKAFGVMEMFELDRYCCNIETVTRAELSTLALEVLDNREVIRPHIARRLNVVQQTLEGWTHHLEN